MTLAVEDSYRIQLAREALLSLIIRNTKGTTSTESPLHDRVQLFELSPSHKKVIIHSKTCQQIILSTAAVSCTDVRFLYIES